MAGRKRQAVQKKPDISWDFFAFPTLAGFAGGALAMALLFIFIPWFYLLLGALFLTTFCATHILFTGTRQRNEQAKRAREEEDEMERRILARRAADDEAGVTSRRARRRRRT